MRIARPTHGPLNRFKNVLLIEKEGFQQIFAAAGIERRYDLAIMSTKGMNTSEVRRLVEQLPGVRFFVMHDFDKSGFSILGTRYPQRAYLRPARVGQRALRCSRPCS